MRTSVFITLPGILASLLGVLILAHAAAAQSQTSEAVQSPTPDWNHPPAIYDPYPPGILPADLNSELARVLREVDVIEDRAIARWRALSPPVLTGQPPTLQNTGTA